MREPYESIILSRGEQLRHLGLELVSNDEFQMVYSGAIQVCLITERYYHPSLSVAITDSGSVTRELGLLEEVVNKPLAETNKAKLTSFSVSHRFKDTDFRLLIANGSFKQYIEMILDQTIDFLKRFQLQTFSLSSDQEALYRYLERQSLVRFGLL